MTYVVAAKHHGRVAIIADFGVSIAGTPDNPPQPSALKTGTLFEGCNYGVAGETGPARAFITDFKLGLPPNWTIRDCWAAFVRHAEQKPRENFQLLLGYRNYPGEPAIYKYDARKAKVEPMGDLATIGAGKTILDAPLDALRSSLFPRWMLQLTERGMLDKWPHLYCLWLNQYAMSDDYATKMALQSAGVAGLFHHIEQTADRQGMQGRAVYCRPDGLDADRTIKLRIWHITKRQEVPQNPENRRGPSFPEFLVMRDLAGDLHIASDTHADPHLKMDRARFTNIDANRFMDDGAEFYGFGFSEPRLFPKAFFVVCAPGDTLPMLWDTDWVDQDILDRIGGIIDGVVLK